MACHWIAITRTRDAHYTIKLLILNSQHIISDRHCIFRIQCINDLKHKPYNAIQAVDLLIREGGGRLLLHDHGGCGALWGWSSTRTETAAWICCFTYLQSTCLSDRKHLQTNNLQKRNETEKLKAVLTVTMNILRVLVYLRCNVF